MSEQTDVKAELKAATERILTSENPKKLVVAGPGAGKTYLFKELLKTAEGTAEQRLVLTFINTLKGDLERNLGDASRVFTLHGYCQYWLRRSEKLRNGLSANFVCYPGLRSLIPQDWNFLHGTDSPTFIQLMRDLQCTDEQRTLYFERGNYYDAVDFDDSVYRLVCGMEDDKTLVPDYKMVLIDEFQDFNRMEASIIDLLAEKNSIVIAGDDDQALYRQLRSASWNHIRTHYVSGHYEVFELPFCMRCPEVIVGAVNDIINKAQESKKLNGRIQKPYRYYELAKGEDSVKYPKIELIETSVQRANANYFGRYIEECIRSILPVDLESAEEENEPVALIIGNNPYRRLVEQHLTQAGLFTAAIKNELTERQRALQILSDDPTPNLGWRIILSVGNQDTARNILRTAFQQNLPLAEVITTEQHVSVLAEAKRWAAQHPQVDLSEEVEEPTHTTSRAD